MRRRGSFFGAVLLVALSLPIPGAATGPDVSPLPPLPWGARGHGIAARAALSQLPAGMPDFFRQAANQLEYLNPEPDRWRSRDLRAMDEAWKYDHYIDLENVPAGALEARDRFEFLEILFAAGIERPHQYVGFLPWRILELYQRLMTEFAIWRNLRPGPERTFVEGRILNDAGILGHYATDATQPHHTTIHFNGWAGDAPNPRGFTMDRGFHSRFESAYVEAHLSDEDVEPFLPFEVRELEDPRKAVWAHVRASNAVVEQMYELEQRHGFDPEASPHPEAEAFVARRLAAGAEMLASLWWTAWVESEALAAQRRARGWGP